jgi:hypothetical protein
MNQSLNGGTSHEPERELGVGHRSFEFSRDGICATGACSSFVGELPEDASNPILLLNESILPTRFIIGHENSFLHGKTKFRLDPRA